jgi:hypothetical protein
MVNSADSIVYAVTVTVDIQVERSNSPFLHGCYNPQYDPVLPPKYGGWLASEFPFSLRLLNVVFDSHG